MSDSIQARNKPGSGCGCNAVLFNIGGQPVMAVFVDGVLQGFAKVNEEK